MKRKVLKLCGNKFVWNDYAIAGVRMVRTLKGFHLTEIEKEAVRLWAEDDSKQVLFIQN